MKKFFYSLLFVLLFSFTSVVAQTIEQQKTFIIQVFPEYMPDYVIRNTEPIAVTKKYAKKHETLFQYVDLVKGAIYQGSVRIGDTLMVFNGQPFYSKGQGLWMYPIVQQKVAKAKKAPKSPEQRARNAQIVGGILSTGIGILGRTRMSSGSYGGDGFYRQ